MSSTTDIVKAYDAEAITVSSTAIGFTASKVVHASNGSIHPREAIFRVETDEIRFRLDGTDPDASTGHLASAGETIKITGEADIVAFRAIRVTNDASIFAHYFKD
jgi:hypothetical protein